MSAVHDPFEARTTIETPLGRRIVYRLDALKHLGDIDTLPYSIKVLLESVLRNHDGSVVTDDDVRRSPSTTPPRSRRPRSPSPRAGSCFRTSPASRPSSTSRRCGPPSCG